MSSGQRKHLQPSFWLEYPQGPQHASLPLCVCVCVCLSLGVLGVGCLLVGLICLMMKIPVLRGPDGEGKGFWREVLLYCLAPMQSRPLLATEASSAHKRSPCLFPSLSHSSTHTSSLTLRYTHTQTRTRASSLTSLLTDSFALPQSSLCNGTDTLGFATAPV